MDEEKASELELLRAMYSGEDELEIMEEESGAVQLAIRLLPHSGGGAAQRYMVATLAFSLTPLYPESTPHVSLVRVRGLVDEEEAALLAGVRAHAATLAGQCCVYELQELALELLTELNGGGDCPVCRDALFGQEAGTDTATYVTPCYHTFHSECIGQWWHTYTPTKSSDGKQLSRADAAAAAARAGAAECSQLREKMDACVCRREALREEIAFLGTLEPPAAQGIGRAAAAAAAAATAAAAGLGINASSPLPSDLI